LLRVSRHDKIPAQCVLDILKDISLAWLLTIPTSAALAAIIYYVIKLVI